MAQSRSCSKILGWTALVLLASAAAAFVIPIALFALAERDDGFEVGESPVTVHAEGESTWGIYFNDADNTGYSESCSVSDGHGQRVGLRGPGPTVSSSGTEMLDHVFTTPADDTFTIECRATGATVRVAPVGDVTAIFVGIAVAGVVGLTGVVLGIVWLTRVSGRDERRAPLPVPVPVHDPKQATTGETTTLTEPAKPGPLGFWPGFATGLIVPLAVGAAFILVGMGQPWAGIATMVEFVAAALAVVLFPRWRMYAAGALAAWVIFPVLGVLWILVTYVSMAQLDGPAKADRDDFLAAVRQADEPAFADYSDEELTAIADVACRELASVPAMEAIEWPDELSANQREHLVYLALTEGCPEESHSGRGA